MAKAVSATFPREKIKMSPSFIRSRSVVVLALLVPATGAPIARAQGTFGHGATVSAPPSALPNAPSTAAPSIIVPPIVGAGKTAPAPIVVPAPKPKPQKVDAQKLLAFLENRRACQFVLDLTVKNASVEDIVARVQKLLPAPAPRIEVRDLLPTRLSFALKQTRAGDALGAASRMAGAKLWVMSDRWLIAPASALTKEETALEWTASGTWRGWVGVSNTEIQHVFSNLIADELLARFPTARSKAKVIDLRVVEGKIPLGKLSPDGRVMLQFLVENFNEEFSRTSPIDALVLSDNTLLEINQSGNINGKPVDGLSINDANHEISWSLEGSFRSGMSSRPNPPKAKPGAVSPPPFLDPSAGKS